MNSTLSYGAVIVAAGSGSRFGSDKMLFNLNGQTVIRRSVCAFLESGFFSEIVIVVGDNHDKIKQQLSDLSVRLIQGGATRFESVKNGVMAINTDIVAVHDGARPFITRKVIVETLSAMSRARIAAPALPVVETVKITDGEYVSSTPNRELLMTVQTPQTFYRNDYLLAASECVDFLPTDDCSVMEHAGHRVLLTKGDIANKKITNRQDVSTNEGIMMRVGQGYDVHRLVEGRDLILGGVKIEYELGLLGHSDADVLCHAISDALLGAAALGDIGKHFPDTDERYRDADSLLLLCEVAKLLRQHGYSIGNIDSVVIAERPKIARFIPEMVKKIAAAIGVDEEQVSVKATTQEGLGFTGRGEGIAASSTVLIYK